MCGSFGTLGACLWTALPSSIIASAPLSRWFIPSSSSESPAVQLAISHAAPFSPRGEKVVAGAILLTIYVIVTTVLLILLRFSSCTKERLYFGLCAASAAFGLVRILLGDPVLHANILRVLLLGCAVIIGTGILRTHSSAATFAGEPEM